LKSKLSFFIIIFLLLLTTIGIDNVQAVDNRRVIEIGSTSNNHLAGYKYVSYTVKAGDSLYKIALEHSTSVNSIMEINSLKSYMIYPGQKLTIAVIEQSSNLIYLVKPGDSLYRISLKYNVPVNSIKETNNLNSNMIYVGQKLEIPVKIDSSDDSNDEDINSYLSVKGTVVISNKTWGSGISRQDSELENKVFPLYDGESATAYQEQEIIVKYKPTVNSQSVEEFEKENNLVTISSVNRPEGKIVKYQISKDQNMEELLEDYNKKENVAWAEPNYIYYPTAIPQDQYYNNYQWNMVNMNMEAAWDVTKGDNSVVVAVIDTGIVPNHPDLKDNLLQGADFVGGVKSYPIESYSITDYNPIDESTYQQGGSHGTHVSGIIGAVSNNITGVAGINWNVKILPIRGLTKTGGTSWDIAEGIYYAIDQGADVINMSFGGNHSSYYQHEAVKDAVDAGITIIAATGNEGSTVYYPAAYPETIAVGAVGRKNIKTAYSNYGPEVDVVAPGGDYGESIISTWGYYKDSSTIADYNGMIGTSMATPHVSGLAALLVASGINNPEEIRSRLINNTIDLGDNGKDNYYGYGLVDAYAALINKKISNPFVFAAEKGGSSLYVKSEISKASDNDSFSLSKVDSNAQYIIAWFDSNDNGIVDGGDFYGEVETPSLENSVRVNMSYISNGTGYPYYQIIK